MKLSLLLLAPVLVWRGVALAQTAPVVVPAPAPDPLKRSVALPATGTSLDDDLIALARAAKINVIADASGWPADAPALNGPRAGAPTKLLETNEERPLSWLKQGDALLVWTRPDVLALARRIAAGENITRIARPPVPVVAAPLPAASTEFGAPRLNGIDIGALIKAARMEQQNQAGYWNSRWNEYLSTLEGGQTRPAGWTRDIALTDLPPDLHAFVLARAQENRLHGARPQKRRIVLARAQENLLPPELMAHWRAWLTEDFWKTARLNIRDMDTTVAGAKLGDPPQKKKVSMLFVGNTLQVTPSQRGNTMMSIANLGDAPVAKPADNTPASTR